MKRNILVLATLGVIVTLLAAPAVSQPLFDENPAIRAQQLGNSSHWDSGVFSNTWSLFDTDGTSDGASSLWSFVVLDETNDSMGGDETTETIDETEGTENEETTEAEAAEEDPITNDDDFGDTSGDTGVLESAYLQTVPEPGDPYFEAQGDGWVSYVNPRDEYHPTQYGDGSGKICMVLLNEDGEPIVGESIPGTQASMETGGIEWHSSANPFTVNFPMTANYDRPLDSDQFGTSSLPQGDGYLDSHCLEAHDLDDDATVTYDEVELSGQYADHVDVVGYYDQTGTWNSDFDPLLDVSPYGVSSSSDGTVTMSPGSSHFEILVVLQLTSSEAA